MTKRKSTSYCLQLDLAQGTVYRDKQPACNESIVWGLPHSTCKKVGRAALDHRIKKWSIVPSWISQLTFNNRLFVPGNTCPDQAEVCLNNRKPLAWQTCEPGGVGSATLHCALWIMKFHRRKNLNFVQIYSLRSWEQCFTWLAFASGS